MKKFIDLEYGYACSERHAVEYDFNKIFKMINDYSIKSGAQKETRHSLSAVRYYDDCARIIKRTEHKRKKKDNKIRGLSTYPLNSYTYEVLLNEKPLVKALLNSFIQSSRMVQDSTCIDGYHHENYIYINFTLVNELIKNNELTEDDVEFLISVLKQINIAEESTIEFHQDKEIGINNSAVLKLIEVPKKEDDSVKKIGTKK